MSLIPIKVLVADDHLVVRAGLQAVLQLCRDVRIVATAAGGWEAVRLFREHRPDVVLMDLRMPEVDGIEATRLILAEFPEARIIMLTTYDTDEDVRQALEAGASGYVLKTSGQDELIQAIQAVHSGRPWLPTDLAARWREIQDQDPLSPRQLEVLELLVKGLSNKEIASTLGFSPDGAKAHLRSIYSKLGVQDRAAAVSEALQRGLIRLG